MKPFRMKHFLFAVSFAALGALPAHAGISYACAANIDAAQAGTCNFLNTNLSPFYDAVFNDVAAKTFIRYGTTGLGASFTALDTFTYAGYRAALNGDRTSADDTTFYNSSLPVGNPFGTDVLKLTHANSRAVGLAAGTNGECVVGIHAGCVTAGFSDATLGNCTITVGNYGNTCFDSIITMSSAQQAAGNLWYRTLSGGAQGGTQFDFFSVVFHESDEVLNTLSLCCGQIAGAYTPSDLARWHSDGTRSHGYGSNAVGCGVADANNACFSIDGGLNFIVQYNNLNNGNDTGDYAGNCQHVQDQAGCLGSSFNPTAGFELRNLDVIGYTSAAPEPATVSIFGIGLAMFAALARKRRARRS